MSKHRPWQVAAVLGSPSSVLLGYDVAAKLSGLAPLDAWLTVGPSAALSTLYAVLRGVIWFRWAWEQSSPDLSRKERAASVGEMYAQVRECEAKARMMELSAARLEAEVRLANSDAAMAELVVLQQQVWLDEQRQRAILAVDRDRIALAVERARLREAQANAAEAEAKAAQAARSDTRTAQVA